MPDSTPPARLCPECAGPMEVGYLLDRTYGDQDPILWIEGLLERSFFGGSARIRDREQVPVQTWRCSDCGALRSYATGPSS